MTESRAVDTFRVEQIDHVELFVPDRRAAAAWYQRVLGLSIIPEYEYWAGDPRGPLMISSDAGSTKLALFEGEPQGSRETAGFHLVAFRVGAEEFERFIDRLPDRSHKRPFYLLLRSIWTPAGTDDLRVGMATWYRS